MRTETTNDRLTSSQPACDGRCKLVRLRVQENKIGRRFTTYKRYGRQVVVVCGRAGTTGPVPRRCESTASQTAAMSALTVMTLNDSGVQDVPADYNVDEDMALFNLSKLSGSDLLPDELSHQVGLSC